MFFVGQIGSAEEAARFLDTLKEIRKNDPEVAKVLHVFAGMSTSKLNATH